MSTSPNENLPSHRRNLSYCKRTLDIHTQIVTYLRPQELIRFNLIPGNHALTKYISYIGKPLIVKKKIIATSE